MSLNNEDPEKFIDRKIKEISSEVKDNLAINTLSGGVDSSVVTILGNKALGDNLKTYFIDNGLMRENEPENIVSIFKKLGVNVELINAKDIFLKRLKGVTDPEEKREAVTQAFYKDKFKELIKKSKAKYLLQGTNLTDVEETSAGIKRQHNVFQQIGIDPQKTFGYKIIEPLKELRKSDVREIAKALGLPEEIYNRPPFPGPALAIRIIGEVTPEKIEIIRKATKVIEDELNFTNAFQYLAILNKDKVTGIKNGKRNYGHQIEIRCWDSKDAKKASPTKLDYEILDKLSQRLTTEISGVVSVTYNITKKPPSTIEAE